ncbi:hypothetical protein llap_10227 [Limosa lapponica baueri]|uniref:Uncharacterized protein n=1 Tax=Limosa lapponica baueri TaxID=1758121 RepID=A0A2I0U063_LIMLA|nr:hypothetical protein llap_10227 [Limosa lapponica baueri]
MFWRLSALYKRKDEQTVKEGVLTQLQHVAKMTCEFATSELRFPLQHMVAFAEVWEEDRWHPAPYGLIRARIKRRQHGGAIVKQQLC